MDSQPQRSLYDICVDVGAESERKKSLYRIKDVIKRLSNEEQNTVQNTREKLGKIKILKKILNSIMENKKEEAKSTQVRGMCRSGRFWKTPKEKFKSIRTVKKSAELHKKFRDEIKRIKAISKSIKEEKKQEKELTKQRREENAQRRKENELKSQTVQIIKNTAKLKRIKKKHLRQIQKRDILELKSKIV